jgi:alpha-tubulin suppressor-like RCC1 family protein
MQHNITKIQASGFNSAAFNEDKQFWIWGGTIRGKLGLNSTMRDQMEPQHVQFEVNSRRKENVTEEEEIYLEPFINEPETMKNIKAEYIS